MAKDFDIFLHRHLTECDILIQSIPFRDGISITDRLILDAVLQGCKLMRVAAGQSNMELVARLDRMIKTCHERLGANTIMDASVALSAKSIMSPVNDPIELSAENLKTIVTMLNSAESDIVMSVEPLVTKISKSLGHMNTQIVSNADVVGDIKKSLLTLRSDTIWDSKLRGELKTGLLDVNTAISMDATISNLCSRIGFDAVAGIEMAAIILGTRLSNSLGRAISGITIDSKVTGTKARKFEAAIGVIQTMENMTAILIKLIYPEMSRILIDAGLSGSLIKRYRLLNEMDSLTLSSLGDMTLDELDYVILAE